MLETVILTLFLLSVIGCLIVDIDVLFALVFGLFLFSGYSLYRGFSFKQTLHMLWTGVQRVKNVLLLLVLIGCMTAVWRASGTIPYILYHAIGFIRPRIFVLSVFLICGGMSFLLGSAFGTASTVGFILMMLSNAAGLPPALTGGAILAGAYFGDRTSPMSASAQLVSALTETDIYQNVRGMLKTCAVPLAVTALLYVVLAGKGSGTVDTSVQAVFAESFQLHWTAVIPAALMLLLALCRVKVKYAMCISIVSGVLVSIFLQGMRLPDVLWCLAAGYRSQGGELLSSLLDGGGIRSMLRVIAIPVLSSSYSGIFDGTGLLDGIKPLARKAAKRITPFGSTLLVGIFAGAACCNQTLGTILTEQICAGIDEDKHRFALTIENTIILTAALVPWGIAGSAPLLSAGAPVVSSMALAFFLYLVPLWNLLLALRRDQKEKRALKNAAAAMEA